MLSELCQKQHNFQLGMSFTTATTNDSGGNLPPQPRVCLVVNLTNSSKVAENAKALVKNAWVQNLLTFLCQKQHNFLELTKLKENVLLEYGLAVPGHLEG